jgi:hypothetical protein
MLASTLLLARKRSLSNFNYCSCRPYVKVTKDENKNYLIQIKLENLAELRDLIHQTKLMSFGWKQMMIKNIGQIKAIQIFIF